MSTPYVSRSGTPGKANSQGPDNRKTNKAFPVPAWNLFVPPNSAYPEFTSKSVPPGIGPSESIVPPLPGLLFTSVNLVAVAYDQSSAPSEARNAFTTPSRDAAKTTSLVTDSAAE